MRKTSPFNHRELWVDLASIDFVGTKSVIERSIMNRDDFIKIMVTADEMVKPMLGRARQ